MKFLSQSALVMSLACILSGCATLLDDDFQEISVSMTCNDKPIRAQCVAENGRGRWPFHVPGTVQVKNEFGSLEITCKAISNATFSVSAPALPSWSFAGNMLLGGLVGAAYDVHNNTALKYPELINISSPTCK